MAKQNDQVARKLKWLDTKEPDPSSLKVKELRGRSVTEELHTPFIKQPPQGPICVHGTVQNLKKVIVFVFHHL